MSFFRGDRTFSPFLRHDPFTPFFPRSSFQSPSPFSRVFDSPFYSPLSPFITVYEEPRHSRYEGSDHSQSSSQKAVEASPSQSSNSTPHPTPSQSQSKEVTNANQPNETGVERRHSGGRRHHHRNGRPQQQMSLWSPFTGSPFNSSLINSAFSPLAPFSQAMQALPEISLDMFSTPQAYSIHASVPGMDKKDIKVTVEDGVLTIQAERKESRGPSQKASSTSSSTQGAATQGSPSSTNTGSQSTSQQSGAEMKYPTEEKEEKGAPSTTTQDSSSSSSSGASTTAETTKDSLPLGSNVQASGSSNTTASGGSSNAMDVENEDDDLNFHHVESFYGRVERSVQLPEDANVDSLTAQYENGILKIDIPRIEQKTKGRRIEIQ